MSAPLRLRSVTKRWGDAFALDGIDLDLFASRYTCVMGPSGSGKSTLLRIIAGLEPPDRGEIRHGDRDLHGVPAEHRPIHSLFQDPALFPHMSVRQNVAFAGRIAGVPIADRLRRADALLEEVGLDPATFGDRDPQTLSGGERQRVAIARALFDPPAFLLLDEPLSATDRGLRDALRRKLAQLQREHAIAFVHVTHEPAEALAVAEDLAIVIDGRIAATGAPAELYTHPPSLAVARLLGEITRVPGGWIRPERLRVRSDAEGRIAVQEIRRVCLGDAWEIELRAGDRSMFARPLAAPSEPVRSLDYADADVLALT